MPISLAHLRRHALARTLFTPTSLPKAIARLRFVQADPIRAPARAQDLTLFQRVTDYRAGDLERRYPQLAIDEDCYVNYGFVTRDLHALMHPRQERHAWSKTQWKQARAVQEFVREHGVVHPREVDAHFAHGKATNWFGGRSNVSTQLLDGMHYRGLVRVARREGGTRCYAATDLHQRPPQADPEAALDALLDAAVAKYAPLPARTLGWMASGVAGLAAPQWTSRRAKALARAKARLPHVSIDGVTWYWPEGEDPTSRRHRPQPDRVRLLAPFDPVVWDRVRFELFWGWAYRFEAYTPAPKRQLGYYALPLLWRDTVIGWANLSTRDGRLLSDLGYVTGTAPRDSVFRTALDDELGRMARFLGVE
jgi:uncharacterized protein